MPQRKPTHVYVAKGKRGTKVGISCQPPKRMNELTLGKDKVKLIKAWHRPKDARDVEWTACGLLAAHRVWGWEWFSVSTGVAVGAVEEAIAKIDAGEFNPPKYRKIKARKEQLEKEREAMYARVRDMVAEFDAKFASGEITEEELRRSFPKR